MAVSVTVMLFCRAVEDIDLWLNEIEGHLASQDLGKVWSVRSLVDV